MRFAEIYLAFYIMFWGLLQPLELLAASPFQQDERRNQIGSPGFVRVSDRPIARINVIQRFGQRLYVAGLDHCVRSYLVNEKEELDWTSVKTYRWPAWREERGEILTLDINDDGTRLAIGGIGLREGTVAEFDIASEQLLRAEEVVKNSVVALDYGPDGSLVVGSAYGEVAVWRPTHEIVTWRTATSNQHYVRDVYASATEAFSIHSDGELWSFSVERDGRNLAKLGATDGIVAAARFTVDGQRVLLGRRRADLRSELIEYDLQLNQEVLNWKSPNRWVVEGLGYANGNGSFMAYGVDDVREGNSRLEYQSQVVRRSGQGSQIVTEKVADMRIGTAYPESDDTFWFVARDSSLLHRRSLKSGNWQSRTETPTKSQIAWTKDQRGICWTIGGRALSFSFDIRQLRTGYDEKLVYRHQEKFKVSPDNGYPSTMSIPMNDRTRRPIPLTISRDGEASCHITFEKDGKNFVAVGHRFGVSLFEFTKQFELRLVRKLIGHQQMVTAIAVSEDRRLLLSLSNDGTICCFTLEPWKYQAETGGKFLQEGDELIVDAVDDGSPVWETGLSTGNRIQRVQLDGKDISIQEALQRLENVEPGREFKFVSSDLNSVVSTRVLQRPIWKFIHDNQDWIVYRWRDYFYDCSTKGDQLVAWFINPDTESQPIVFKAERARERFYQPAKLKDLLSLDSLKAKRIQVAELIPPVVQLNVEERADQWVVKATMKADDNALLVGEPEELSIWLGDLRVSQKFDPKIQATETVTIDKSLLRNGKNRLIARAYNRFGVRGDSDFEVIENESPKPKSKLWGLVMGVQDYAQTSPPADGASESVVVPDLNWSLNDAIGMEASLKNKTAHFENSDVRLLTDGDVNRQRLAEELQRIRAACRPDDFLVLSFAGHGHRVEQAQNDEVESTFVLLTADSQLQSQKETLATSLPVSNRHAQNNPSATFQSLFDELAALPCRKLVIVDACHSGGAVEMVRALTPDFVVGPMVLTAASKNQFAIEVPSKLHGIFTASILEATGKMFSKADRNQDQLLSVAELSDYCSQRVPQIFSNSEQFMAPEDFSRGQTPEFWAPEADRSFPIFGSSTSP